MQSSRKDDWKTFEINASEHAIYSVSFTQDNKRVLGGGQEGMLQKWAVDDGHQVGELIIQISGAQIYAVALSPDARRLACGLYYPAGNASKAYLQIWDARTYEKVMDIHGHTHLVYSLDISFDSTTIVSGTFDKQAFVWSLSTGQKLVGPLQHNDRVVAVRFSPTSDRIATVSSSISIYDSRDGQKLLDILFDIAVNYITSPLVWSADGGRLFVASRGEAKCFNTSSGDLFSRWVIPAGYPTSIVLGGKERFISVSTGDAVSFWDTSSHQQIGTTIKYASRVMCLVLSPDNRLLATSEDNGKITLHNLGSILPETYFNVKPPLFDISDATFESWKQSNWTRAEELLTEDITHSSNLFNNARSLACRSLVRARLRQWTMAAEDAKKSLEAQRSTIGSIANTLALIGSGEQELALRKVDLMFRDSLPGENDFLLLIKAIILFECGKHDEAILRIEDLIDVVDDKSPYTTVRAQMFLLLGNTSMRNGDYEQTIEMFERAQEAMPFEQSPHLVTISLIFGWDFERLPFATWIHQLCKSMHGISHTTFLDSFSTMATSLGIDVLTSEVSGSLKLVEGCTVASEKNELRSGNSCYTGDTALCHVLEEIVTRSGDVAVLSWSGKPSDQNSCLPAGLSAYSRIPCVSPMIEESDLGSRITAPQDSLTQMEAKMVYNQITRLPPARFSNHRLYLPCVVFAVKRLEIQGLGDNQETHYRARVSRIGHVEFQTSDKLSLEGSRRLVFVLPWIRYLYDPLDELGLDTSSDEDDDFESVSGSGSPPSSSVLPGPSTKTDNYTRALQLINRLQQPFHALLLQQQPSGEYKRVASEHRIILPGPERRHLDDMRTEVVEVL